MSILSKSLERIKPSPTISVTQKARELKAKGADIISLGSGEPDFDTPDNVKSAAIEAIKNGQTKYTAVDGTVDLKNAIVSKFKKENNLTYEKNQISVGAGGKQVIYNAFLATINSGDEIIIPSPFWVSYPDIVLLAGGIPKIIECGEEDNFKLTAKSLKKNITQKTKWLIINSPGNPTGSCYSEQEINELVDVLVKYPKILIMSDDIYEHIIYDEFNFYTPAQNNKIFDRTLTINGVSKSYAMTGWRIGYAGGPEEIIKGMAKLQSQSTTNPSSISQAAAVEALKGDQSFIQTRKKVFKKRRDFIVEMLNKINGIECIKPQGAFYVFPSCKKLIGKKHKKLGLIKNDKDFVTKLLESYGVAVVQGSAFGLDGYFRISYAASDDELKKAIDRITKFCSEII